MQLFGNSGAVVWFKEKSAGWEGGKPKREPITKVVLIDKRTENERVFHYLWKVDDKKWVHACQSEKEIPMQKNSLKPYITMLEEVTFDKVTPQGNLPDFPDYLYNPLFVQCMLLGETVIQTNMDRVLKFCQRVSVDCANHIQKGLRIDNDDSVRRYLDYDIETYLSPDYEVASSTSFSSPQQPATIKEVPQAPFTAPPRAMEPTDAANDAFTRFSTGEIHVPWVFTSDIDVAVDRDNNIITIVQDETKSCLITVGNAPAWFLQLIPNERVPIKDISALDVDTFTVNVIPLPYERLVELRDIRVEAKITAIRQSPPGPTSPEGPFPSPSPEGPPFPPTSPGVGPPPPTPPTGGGVVPQRVVLTWDGREWRIVPNESDYDAVQQLLSTGTTIKDMLGITASFTAQ